MTSLAGIVYPDMLQVADNLDPMIDIMKHHPSDTVAQYNYKNFQFGCLNTLFFSNPKKTVFLCLDGKITNTKRLAKEFDLSAPNLTQEEILIAGYEKKGIDFLKMIDGEFAIVLIDQEKNTFYLVRDRIGKKPLYWYQDRQYFLFSSELKSLLASNIVPQTVAAETLSAYLFFGYTPQDLTPIKEVNKLLPAHFLRYSQGHGQTILPYWSYSSFYETISTQSKQQIAEQVHLLLQDSVDKCLQSTSSNGCFLSGGLGSATVAYYVSQSSKIKHDSPLAAFNVGFQGQNEEDILAAQTIAKDLRLNLFSTKIDSQSFLKDIVRIAWFLDEPLADPNAVATWNLCQLAANQCNTVFSGMGSDELLAGHSRYSTAERDMGFVNRLFLIPKPILHKILIPTLKFLFRPAAFNLLRIARTNPWQFEYLRDNALFDEKHLLEAAPRLAGLFDPDTFLHKFHHLSRIRSMVSSFQYFDVKTRMTDCFIFQYSRLTRTHRLDWQTPFLDRHLVEYAAHLPEPEMLQEEETASYLKPLIKHVFPATFFNRPKKTRKHFLAPWMKDQKLYETMKLLKKGTLVETGFISEKWLEEQLSDPLKASLSFRHLFAILMLEIWFRLFINRPVGLAPPSIELEELLREN
ncbi:Asparagine synthetase [Chlamydiales bacterium STE3]|nr:Asparagine synthetase [Chlamydiales bacterium STE3]